MSCCQKLKVQACQNQQRPCLLLPCATGQTPKAERGLMMGILPVSPVKPCATISLERACWIGFRRKCWIDFATHFRGRTIVKLSKAKGASCASGVSCRHGLRNWLAFIMTSREATSGEAILDKPRLSPFSGLMVNEDSLPLRFP